MMQFHSLRCEQACYIVIGHRFTHFRFRAPHWDAIAADQRWTLFGFRSLYDFPASTSYILGDLVCPHSRLGSHSSEAPP